MMSIIQREGKHYVMTRSGHELELSESELKYLRAFQRLEKIDSGRFEFFANAGSGSIRLIAGNSCDEIMSIKIQCDGGDSD